MVLGDVVKEVCLTEGGLVLVNLGCQFGLRNTEDICKGHFCCACEGISRDD